MKREKRITLRLTGTRALYFDYLMEELEVTPTKLMELAITDLYVWHVDRKERAGELTLKLRKDLDKKLKHASIEYEIPEQKIIEMLILLYLKTDDPFGLLVEAYKADLDIESIGTRYKKDAQLDDAEALVAITKKLAQDMKQFNEVGQMIIEILVDRVQTKLDAISKEESKDE